MILEILPDNVSWKRNSLIKLLSSRGVTTHYDVLEGSIKVLIAYLRSPNVI